MSRSIFILVLLPFFYAGYAQEQPHKLDYETFIELVMNNHPYAFQAGIAQSKGESRVRQSRGAFDPVLFGNASQKYFDDTQYYSRLHGGLKVPTWFGISAEMGYTLNEGQYLNPENNIPNAGLWYAGLRLELGNGLLLDKRRAELQKAKLYQTSSEIDRMIMLNQLKRDASIAFWQWKRAYDEATTYRYAFQNASVRLEAVKVDANMGERPYIDTVEASMIAQNRNLQRMKAETYLENAELKLEVYLWTDGFIPLELENTIPGRSTAEEPIRFSALLDSAARNHPLLQVNQLKIEQQQIDLKLQREQLKPLLTLKYNAINEPVGDIPVAAYTPSNYTWGASFSYPIFTRKERGNVQLAELQLLDQKLDMETNKASLKYQINATFNNYTLAQEQLRTNKDLVDKNRKMYDAEKVLFDLGESSLFMINQRESAWLKAQIQLIKSENEYSMQNTELTYQLMFFETR